MTLALCAGYFLVLLDVSVVNVALPAIGHRRIVLTGLTGFGLSSVLCALAPSLGLLVIGRALQGVGAALMLPGTLAMLTGSADDDGEQTRLVALWAAIGGSALPAGPLIRARADRRDGVSGDCELQREAAGTHSG
ncbi:MAG TPA: MFS transporter [Marmoricola sp.]|nr:MFS transporter [Marmoricola sp.]